MIGSYIFNIRNKKVNFELNIDRQFTIIRGNSSTGKSYFTDIVYDYYNRVENGLSPQSKVYTTFTKVVVVKSMKDLKDVKGALVIADEQYATFKSDSFSNIVKKSDNYYLLICRDDLPNIPYSVKSIYRFESNLVRENGKVYTKTVLKNFYSDVNSDVKPTKLLTEDLGLGLDFYKYGVLKNSESTKGNGNMLSCLVESGKKEGVIVGVVDSAAFGPFIKDVVDWFKKNESKADLYLLLPESFEWLVLKSDLFKHNNFVQKVLREPHNYCDTTKFESWEKLFTAVAISEFKRDYNLNYSKSGSETLLNLILKSKGSIIAVLKDISVERE